MPTKHSTIQDLPKQEFLDLYSEISDRFPKLNHLETEICVLKLLGFSQDEIASYFGIYQQKISRILRNLRKKAI